MTHLSPQVLVVDDEDAIVLSLEVNLAREGFGVLVATTGDEALELLRKTSPVLILLDVGLPDMDGFEVCRRLREFTSVPVVMVTAWEEETHTMAGFEAGADDYVVKPFNPRILMARIKAILRRSGPASDFRIAYGELHLDILRRKITMGDRSVDLTPREYDLLLYFLRHPGRVFSREHLLKEVWGSEFLEARSVDVHVKYLREKLRGPLAAALQTVWGKGYMLAPLPS